MADSPLRDMNIVENGVSELGRCKDIILDVAKTHETAVPTADTHAATKKYVDDKVLTVPGSNEQVIYNAGGNLGANGNFLYDGTRASVTQTPTADNHVVNKVYLDSQIWPNMVSGYVDPDALTAITIASFPDFDLIFNAAPSAQWFQIKITATGDNKAYTLGAEKSGGTYQYHEFNGEVGNENDLWYLTDDKLTPSASEVFQYNYGCRFHGSLTVDSNITDYFYGINFIFAPRLDSGSDITRMGFWIYSLDTTNEITA